MHVLETMLTVSKYCSTFFVVNNTFGERGANLKGNIEKSDGEVKPPLCGAKQVLPLNC